MFNKETDPRSAAPHQRMGCSQRRKLKASSDSFPMPWWAKSTIQALDDASKDEVGKAVEGAKSSPAPQIEDLQSNIYYKGTEPLSMCGLERETKQFSHPTSIAYWLFAAKGSGRTAWHALQREPWHQLVYCCAAGHLRQGKGQCARCHVVESET